MTTTVLADVGAAVLAAAAAAPVRATLLVGVAALLEGPVVTVTAGALAGVGVLPWWGVLLAAICADLLGDTLLYALGRHGDRGRPRRVLVRLGLTDQRRDELVARVRAHLPRVVIAAKLVDLAAVPMFLAAGLAGVGLQRFLSWAVPATVLRSGLLVGVGVLTGDRFAEYLTTRPWLLAVTGLAVAALLIVGRTAVARLGAAHDRGPGTVVAAGAPAVRLPLPVGADPGAPPSRERS